MRLFYGALFGANTFLIFGNLFLEKWIEALISFVFSANMLAFYFSEARK